MKILEYRKELEDEFLNLLDNEPEKGRQKEQIVQEFLEKNSELIPVQNKLGHGVHFDIVISKFPLTTNLITDYIWITKQSDRWRVILVELESPDKDFFTDSMDRVRPSAEFNAALDQVRSWKRFVESNKSEIIRRLTPLLQPENMRSNPIDFCYELIIGRSKNKNASKERKEYIVNLEKESGVKIMSFDTIIGSYKNNPRTRKNVMKLSGERYAFKEMNFLPRFFDFLGPDVIKLTPDEVKNLKAEGYEIDYWLSGEPLTLNSGGKLTHKSEMERLPEDNLHRRIYENSKKNNS